MFYSKLVYDYFLKDTAMVHFSEIDVERYELRVVDLYADNSLGYANEKTATLNCFLSEEKMPTIDEFYNSGIYETEGCDMLDITKKEFEEMWLKAHEYCQANNIEIRHIRRYGID